MAAQERLPPVGEVEYEYEIRRALLHEEPCSQACRYESLPPNFSLAANMLAGAFAGIAVRLTAKPWGLNPPLTIT